MEPLVCLVFPTGIGESLYLTSGTTRSWTAFRHPLGAPAEQQSTWDRSPPTGGRRISTPRASSTRMATVFKTPANPDSRWFRRTSASATAATPTSTTPTWPVTRASTRYSRYSAGMSLNRIRRVSRTRGPTWSTTQADPPTVQRAGEPLERYAGTPASAQTWRTLPNRFLYPLPCEYRVRSIAQWQTVLLPAAAALRDASIRLGLPQRVGRVSPARTVSSNSARSPSRLLLRRRQLRMAGSMAK